MHELPCQPCNLSRRHDPNQRTPTSSACSNPRTTLEACASSRIHTPMASTVTRAWASSGPHRQAGCHIGACACHTNGFAVPSTRPSPERSFASTNSAARRRVHRRCVPQRNGAGQRGACTEWAID
ncbi:hypothetical protein H310_13704 [Aphanomyces invadans]|uniref:Uncharacterized protein n=1 Tax=Aphanomyces invadans TaxID=157072 RepID=A0A024TEC6_9STRA|nr:hypothetical protein H310_13704 [Aphanomyces invadans]ETV91916.1 hypothetical protein H310_13704 [Aphanomyces invadans]|eukprot:XP_008879553.1 hypothetical protein H310_13704 [Aphanomyces invadans]